MQMIISDQPFSLLPTTKSQTPPFIILEVHVIYARYAIYAYNICHIYVCSKYLVILGVRHVAVQSHKDDPASTKPGWG